MLLCAELNRGLFDVAQVHCLLVLFIRNELNGAKSICLGILNKQQHKKQKPMTSLQVAISDDVKRAKTVASVELEQMK